MQKGDPCKAEKITSYIGFIVIKSCISMKLSRKINGLQKISSLAQVITKKTIKNSYFGQEYIF